jgi:uncharacterized protein with von Willebrand factor type A (vWA) domain
LSAELSTDSSAELPAAPAVLGRVDRAAFAVALAVRLRRHGVPVDFTAIETLAGALAVSPPRSRSALYWTARIALVRRQSELTAFDAVFAAVFDDAVLAMDPNARRSPNDNRARQDEAVAPVSGPNTGEPDGAGVPWSTLPTPVADADDGRSELSVPLLLPSELAGLSELPFESLTESELRALGAWLESALRDWPRRRTRRMRIDPTGHRIALRATLARSRRTGWEPVELVHVRPADKPRRVVVLCDVSQSMQAQAGAYVHLMRALALQADAEAFAFSTTLTRLSATLAHRSPDVAIEQAAAKVVDRFGGTRIATNVQALLASHHGGAVRGAIVILASDGWDSDPPEEMARAMARLHRRAHRVIWLNPRASAAGFEPRVGAMAAALPYCDALLPADSFGSLATAMAEVARSVSSTAPVSSTALRESTGGTGRR